MKKYIVIKTKHRTDTSSSTEALTVPELVSHFQYTLDCGHSWEREKGNKKINTAPKTIKSLITNLNNAVNNSAANGYAGISYAYQDA